MMLYERFALGVDRFFDVWLDKPLKDEAERYLLIEHLLAFLTFYKGVLERNEAFQAAGALTGLLADALADTDPSSR